MTPDKDIEKILFEPTINAEEFIELIGHLEFVNHVQC